MNDLLGFIDILDIPQVVIVTELARIQKSGLEEQLDRGNNSGMISGKVQERDMSASSNIVLMNIVTTKYKDELLSKVIGEQIKMRQDDEYMNR